MSIIAQVIKVATPIVTEAIADVAANEIRKLGGVDAKPKKRTRKRKLTSQDDKRKLHKLQKRKCKGCERQFAMKDLEVDHIRAVSKGGADTMKNKQLLCPNCNKTKGNGSMKDLKKRLKKKQHRT